MQRIFAPIVESHHRTITFAICEYVTLLQTRRLAAMRDVEIRATEERMTIDTMLFDVAIDPEVEFSCQKIGRCPVDAAM